jgi:hypothetical protein
MEGVVDVVLKGSGGIAEAKRHYKRFEEAKACDKGCFPFMAFGDAEFIKSGNNVELRIDFGVAESI